MFAAHLTNSQRFWEVRDNIQVWEVNLTSIIAVRRLFCATRSGKYLYALKYDHSSIACQVDRALRLATPVVALAVDTRHRVERG